MVSSCGELSQPGSDNKGFYIELLKRQIFQTSLFTFSFENKFSTKN